jgi:hypothetical protein
MRPEEFADEFHDEYVDYNTMRQDPTGTAFEGYISRGNKRYRYRAVMAGSSGFEVEDEERIAGNTIADAQLVERTWIFEGNIPGRFRVHGPVDRVRVQVESEPSQIRRWLRWRSHSE